MYKCNCGNLVASNARFCPKCGRRFTNLGVQILAAFFGVVIVGSILVAMFSLAGGSIRVSNSESDTPASSTPTVVSTDGATGKPPAGFRTFKWGTPPNKSVKLYMPPTDEGLTTYVPITKPQPLFDVPVAEEDYAFVHRRFYQGDAFIDGAGNLQLVKTALMKTFGNPSFANDGLKIWKWKWPKQGVEVSLSYQDRFSRTTVTFTNSAVN